MNNGAPALPARPARAPRGFTAEDRCATCEGRAKTLTYALDGTGNYVVVAGGNPDLDSDLVRELIDCDDCDGKGWAKPVEETETREQYRARRMAEHDAYVAEHGAPAASCGFWWCRCP